MFTFTLFPDSRTKIFSPTASEYIISSKNDIRNASTFVISATSFNCNTDTIKPLSLGGRRVIMKKNISKIIIC